MTEILSIEEWRHQNIVYCPTCEQDTMPNLISGRCFFCETKLTAARRVPDRPSTQFARCEWCDERFVVPTRAPTKRYCTEKCRKRAGRFSAAGFARQDRHSAERASQVCSVCGGKASRRSGGAPPRCRPCWVKARWGVAA